MLVVTKKFTVFWDMMLCTLVDRWQQCGEHTASITGMHLQTYVVSHPRKQQSRLTIINIMQ